MEVEEVPEAQQRMIFLRFGFPVEKKSTQSLLQVLQYLVMKLRNHGLEVNRIHCDRGSEYISRATQNWMLQHDIMPTYSVIEDHKGNGPGEHAVAWLKGRARTLLQSTKLPTKLWPLAINHVTELEFRRVGLHMDDQYKDIKFGQLVMAKTKVFSRVGRAVGDVFESSSSLMVWLGRDRRSLRAGLVGKVDEDGKLVDPLHIQLVTTVWFKTVEPPKAATRAIEIWLEKDDEEPMFKEEYEVSCFQVSQKYIQEIIEDWRKLHNVQEELTCEVKDEEYEKGCIVMRPRKEDFKPKRRIPVKSTPKLKSMKMMTEEEDIKVTQTIPWQEVKEELDLWRDALQAELDALLEMQAVEVVDRSEIPADAIVLPGKAVFTKKPPKEGKRGHRKKARACVCGNFETSTVGEVYAAGCDITVIRTILRIAAILGWDLGTLDIKNAFLNASLENARGGKLIVMIPPVAYTKSQLCTPEQMWILRKALYGLRDAPLAWNNERNVQLKEMVFLLGRRRMKLKQSSVEPNLWLMTTTPSGESDELSTSEAGGEAEKRTTTPSGESDEKSTSEAGG
jgi:hypothetical protein